MLAKTTHTGSLCVANVLLCARISICNCADSDMHALMRSMACTTGAALVHKITCNMMFLLLVGIGRRGSNILDD
jgi:hypothetical protein